MQALLAFGIALPTPAPSVADASKPSPPYPCQDHRCGCRDADHCWRSCCCMSREEKFAWAVAHSVTPPASFYADTRTHHAPRDVAPAGDQPARACCAHAHRAPLAAVQPAKRSSNRGSKRVGVTLIDALKCHGQSLNWVLATPATMRPQVSAHLFQPQLAGAFVPADRAAGPVDSCLSPPEPPPRAV